MSKTPIEPSEIRKGDLIRYENRISAQGFMRAAEFVATRDSHGYLPASLGGQHYLLDRPTPPVDLPTEPTLGWLTVTDMGVSDSTTPGRVLGMFRQQTNGVVLGGLVGSWSPEFVTAFTSATAVPTAALDELGRRERAYYLSGVPVAVERDALRAIITDFVDAIKKANA